MFSLDSVNEVAKPIIERAAAVYYKHTKDWIKSIILHGSALKGGFIPGCSDIDLKVVLDDSAFDEHSRLPLEKYFCIHLDLSKIDPSPFRYIQCDMIGSKLPDGYVGPVRGAYRIIWGDHLIPEATEDQLVISAANSLNHLDPVPKFAYESLLDHGGNRLSHNVRLLCTKVWPTLYHVLIMEGHDPISVWQLMKQDAMNQLRNNELKAIAQFF